MQRLIAIGDIHGRSDAIRAVIEAIKPTSEDQFVFLGDLINRGPDSKGVIDTVIELKSEFDVKVICGNHEEMVLAAFHGGESDHRYWTMFGGDKTIESFNKIEDRSYNRVTGAKDLPGLYMRFIADCLDYVETEDHIFVHAGCKPDIAVSKNTGMTFRWEKLPPITERHISGKTVICGHTAHGKIVDREHIICIDTGCGVWPTGILTALDVISGDTWQYSTRSKSMVNRDKNLYKMRNNETHTPNPSTTVPDHS